MRCNYCGRESQPRDAVNCCGCGAPLRHKNISRGVLITPDTLSSSELLKLRGDWEAAHNGGLIDVTTFADTYRQLIPAISQAKPIKRS